MKPQGFVCWLLHRGAWLTLIPGLLPWKMDGEHFCPRCDDMTGGPSARVRNSRLAYAGGFA